MILNISFAPTIYLNSFDINTVWTTIDKSGSSTFSFFNLTNWPVLKAIIYLQANNMGITIIELW